jgi:chlorobactene glucosyltransferase
VVLLVLSFVWVVVVFWLILRALRQRSALPALNEGVSAIDRWPHLTIIVPARDEAAKIGRCLSSLIAQDYPRDRLRIIAVDDDSTDGTAEVIARYVRADERIALLQSPPLPLGWTGKVNACCAGVRAAPADSDWFCFLDADMCARPALLRSALTAARSRGLDLLSLAPQQELRSFAERLIIPCGLYLVSFLQDLSRIQALDSKDAVVTGQFMLIKRDAYERIGGFGAVCTSVVEDVEFARLLKRSGGRVLMLDGTRLLSTRMYTGWDTLWPGIAKNLVHMLGGVKPTLLTGAVALSMAWAAVLLPIFGVVACAGGTQDACVAAVPALIGSAAAFGLHIAGTAYFRIPLVYGLLFPLGYTAGAVIAAESLRWRLRGRVWWKGRVY